MASKVTKTERRLLEVMAVQSPVLYKLWVTGRCRLRDAFGIWLGREWDGNKFYKRGAQKCPISSQNPKLSASKDSTSHIPDVFPEARQKERGRS